MKKIVFAFLLFQICFFVSRAQKINYKLIEIDSISLKKYYVLTFKEKKIFKSRVVKYFTYKDCTCKNGIKLKEKKYYKLIPKEFDRFLITGRDPRGYIVNGKKILEHYEKTYTSDNLCGIYYIQGNGSVP